MVDYIDNWNEFFDVTTKYKSYWRDSFRDFMDDSDEENYYERPFLTSDVPLSYTEEECKSFRNDPVISEDCEFFYSLVNDTKQVDFNIIGAGTTFAYTIVGGRSDRKAEIIVFSLEGKIYTVCENLENKKRVYDKKEDAGAYILKWILGHID